MRINKVEIENFKSFEKQSLEAKKCNILVGANASGKTNVFQVFEFLKKIKKEGIHEAVAAFGGIKNLKNFNTKKRTISIKVDLVDGTKIQVGESQNSKYRIYKIRNGLSYEITLVKKNVDFDIREELIFSERFIEEDNDGNFVGNLTSEFRYSIKNTFGKFEIPTNEKEIKREDKLSNGDDFKLRITTPFPVQFIEELNANYKKKSLLQYPGVFIPPDLFDFGIYDFEPKQAKKLINDAYAKELDKSAGNLVLLVKEILSNPEDKDQFIADISALLDFIDDVNVISVDKYLKLGIKESFNNTTTDGFLLSDGTIAILATLVALYYQDNQIVFFEEPEHGIHPSLIAALVETFYDVADGLGKQIFITTHSPQLLKHIPVDDLLLVARNENGSQITLPKDQKMVKAFLKEELGLDDLFVDNLLNV